MLASSAPRDAVDDAVAVAGRQARRRDGKLPPHVMVYFAMAMALFGGDDYEEVAARLAGTLASWGCWDAAWSVPASGGITQARQRLGYEPLRELFAQVAVPVAGLLTRRHSWRAGGLWHPRGRVGCPGHAGERRRVRVLRRRRGCGGPAAFPKVRVVTVSECGSHAVVDAEIGGVAGKGAGEQSLARRLYSRLDADWLLLADRNFYNWEDWCAAADTGAALLWRVKSDLALPLLEPLPDGSYVSVLVSPEIRGKARGKLIEAARSGKDLDLDQARRVRVAEYEVPDRDGDGKGELIALITTITGMTEAPGGAGPRLPRKVGARDRKQAAQDAPAWSRPGAAVQEPGHGPPRDLRIPAHPLGYLRPDLPGRHRG